MLRALLVVCLLSLFPSPSYSDVYNLIPSETIMKRIRDQNQRVEYFYREGCLNTRFTEDDQFARTLRRGLIRNGRFLAEIPWKNHRGTPGTLMVSIVQECDSNLE